MIKKDRNYKLDKNEALNTNRHYTTEEYECTLVWGCAGVGNESAYSDRMAGWDLDNYINSVVHANECNGGTDIKGAPRSAKFYEDMLKSYYRDDSIELTAVYAGINWSNGYPYQAFEWKSKAATTSEELE